MTPLQKAAAWLAAFFAAVCLIGLVSSAIDCSKRDGVMLRGFWTTYKCYDKASLKDPT